MAKNIIYFVSLLIVGLIFVNFFYTVDNRSEKEKINSATYEKVCKELEINQSDCILFSEYLYDFFDETNKDPYISISNLREKFVMKNYDKHLCDVFVIFSITRVYGE